MYLFFFVLFHSLYFYIPLSDVSVIEWLWNLGLPGLLVAAVALWTNWTAFYGLRKETTWTDVGRHFALTSLIPLIGMSGMLYFFYQFLGFMGDSPESGETIVLWMSYWCKLGFFANFCLLSCFLSGFLLILKVQGVIPLIFQKSYYKWDNETD